MDYYSSREYLKNETMTTNKQSIGLSFADMDGATYKKLELELALPEGLGSYHGMPSFVKADGFLSRNKIIIEDKLKLVY